VKASYVQSDHAAGVMEAIRHLVRQGHRRIALLTGPVRYRSARERKRGLDRVAEEAPGVTFLHRAVELTEEDGHDTFGALLAEPHRPTAVVVGGNRLLVGVLRALASAGLEPGPDMAIVTSDALPLASMFRPPLASIQRDGARIGRTAAEVLLSRLADPAATPGSITLPVTYVPRASAAPAPALEI
jgi:LacI family transcriptional regulator